MTDNTQSAAHSEDKILQNVLLIWLDNNFDDYDIDYLDKKTELKSTVKNVEIFIDGEECIQFVNSITDDKTCMIISDLLGPRIVPCIYNMSQVDSIFILCDNKNHDEQWTKQWSKIKGVFTEISPIIEALKQAARQCERNVIPISFMTMNYDVSTKKLDQLEPIFMYTQILKEILLTIKFNEGHFKEFINYCRIPYASESYYIDELESRYYDDTTSIYWYTEECFLYRMLNHALRSMDVNIMIKMGFFITDLYRQIEQLHSEQFNGVNANQTFTVYRGQGVSTVDFEHMMKSQGGLISFNNFLSTSRCEKVSHRFVGYALENSDLIGIHFIMTINPTKSTIPFASINHVSRFPHKEDEILFSMNSVFRIGQIKQIDDNNRRFQVELILTNDKDKDLCALTDRIKEETFPHENGWHRLGLFLVKIGQSEKASKVYEDMLSQTTDQSTRGSIYERLAAVKHDQGKYQEALNLLEEVFKIYEKTGIWNLYFAAPYYMFGMVYNDMGQYEKALSSYKNSLEIQQKWLPPDHSDLAKSYNGIGEVYLRMRKHPEALPFFEKARSIQERTLPPKHPDCIYPYKNIGDIYDKICDWSRAHYYYKLAVDIGQRSLPANHPGLQQWRKNLELLKEKI